MFGAGQKDGSGCAISYVMNEALIAGFCQFVADHGRGMGPLMFSGRVFQRCVFRHGEREIIRLYVYLKSPHFQQEFFFKLLTNVAITSFNDVLEISRPGSFFQGFINVKPHCNCTLLFTTYFPFQSFFISSKQKYLPSCTKDVMYRNFLSSTVHEIAT